MSVPPSLISVTAFSSDLSYAEPSDLGLAGPEHTCQEDTYFKGYYTCVPALWGHTTKHENTIHPQAQTARIMAVPPLT